ncbi:unnamed protein product [Alopecurus aequalis]
MAAVLEPGSLAYTSPAVAKMLQRWNYQEGWGLGARGQGIVAPIKATMRCPKAGIGHMEEPYDNGLAAPPPPPSMGGDDSAETASALAAIVESKEVFDRQERTPGTWKATLPPSTTRYLVEEVITPRMAVDAREWDPSWNPQCHHWLRPLIPLVGHLPASLFGVVEGKINSGDYNTVSLWKQYLHPTQWDVFNRRHVLPKLARLVRELRVTAPKQTDSSFRKLMLWKGALRHWLLAAWPPLAEATAWCNGWKDLFTPELLEDERVLAHLQGGLAMVHHAAQHPARLIYSN